MMNKIHHSPLTIHHSPLTIHHSVFCTPRACNARGTAAIETAIILPLYLIVIFGLIYFGYATLGKQRQTLAASYASWLAGEQQADELLEEFWPWEGEVTQAGSASARAGDTELSMSEDVRFDDYYYAQGMVPCQLEAGIYALGGGEENTFDSERITVSLWNMALGEIRQCFVWVPGEGIVEEITVDRDQVGDYLADFVDTGTPSDPVPPEIDTFELRLSLALNGIGDGNWLERRIVNMDATYRPPFFKKIYREDGAARTDFGTFVSGDYPEPRFQPTVAMTFDLTGRGEATRNAAGEGYVTPDDLISEVGDQLFDNTLDNPDSMDGIIESLLGSDIWTAQ